MYIGGDLYRSLQQTGKEIKAHANVPLMSAVLDLAQNAYERLMKHRLIFFQAML